ncbi:heat shock protein 90, putative [Bodo saltans]|uniref:Heat shock protein 90, putative n=1 Tax=Bodo saltans TaxID=75058 RepID=A0A0S4KLS2_BODSA|nr:heat shock protein 90, putative [Bodo saltans]|eukprot:CUI14452.1 heat shock protein 90, putative [Bodo saltans]
MRLSLIFRIACVALLAFAIVGEESASGKGSPITFQAEVSKMLDILINSLYTNRNIFLREIISNASDALDKIRFFYLTTPREPTNANGEAPTMDIRIVVDREKRLFIMRDGGVGMTKEELAANLGSLGSSGTKRFLEKMKDSSDANFIGQFGVGFYSVFLVADKVRVASKHDDSEKQWVWESTGDGTFFLYEDERGNTLGRGSELTLELKKDADEYLDIDKVKEAIHKYSEFIHFPIYIQTTKTEKVKKAAEAESTEAKEDGDDEAPAEEKKVEEEEVVTHDWELINENKPIWTRKAVEITDAEYNSFFKSLTKDYDDPMFYTHFSAEGEVEFRSILFIPSHSNTNVFDTSVVQANIRLYVRRVFITDDFRDLLPRYLNFIKGVVDSDDLPLNVSREVLQESRILRVIKKKLVRKALAMIADIAASDKKLEAAKDDDEAAEAEEKKDDVTAGNKQLKASTYPKFWEEYGKNIRLGMIEDGSNRARLTKLLRYKSSKSDNKLISLQDYVDRMPESQKDIYYVSAESIEKIKQLPVLEDATNRNLEVLFMTDAIDEYVVGHVTDFAGKKLVNLAKEGVKFEDESKREKAIDAKRKEKYEPVLKYFKDLLGEQVTKVVLTKRKTSEPIILSSRQHDVTARMANIIRGQALGDAKQNEAQTAKRVMEINHLHPLIEEIFKRVKADDKDKVAEDVALVLFDTANLQNGFDIEDTLAFSRRMSRLLRQSVDIPADAAMLTEDVSEYEIEDNEDAEDDEAPKADADDDKEEL